jgi:hypothetical protein
VDISLATNGGDFDHVLGTGIVASPWSLRVPHLPGRYARIRIERASPLSTALTDSFFTIDATIALLEFQANAADGAAGRATHLSWKTAPGPEADVRYRVERATREKADGSAAEFAPIHAGLLERGEYFDMETGATSRYRLVAVNGLGEEYVLGETASAPALGGGRSLVASPNVARDGNVEITFRVVSDLLETDVAVFDASGRLVRGLASGAFPAGSRSIAWDRRNDRGEQVSAGVYLVRLAWGGQPRETTRVTLVR